MRTLHWSQLRHMRQSPAHYKHFLDHPFEMTPAMRLGWLVHQLVFDQDDYVVFEGARRGKVWAEFKAEHEGAEIVTAAERETATAIYHAVRGSEQAGQVLVDGDWEQPIEWQINGRDCAGRPDVLGAGLTDLKVTQDSSPERFPWHARKMGWHGQLSWYGEACHRIHGHYPDRYSIVAVEPRAPHVVTVFDLSEAAIEEGTKLWRLLFDSLQVHEASDEWPGYTQSFAVFDVPQDEVLLIDGEEVTV